MKKGKIVSLSDGYQVIWCKGMNARMSKKFSAKILAIQFAEDNDIVIEDDQ